jgi:hypothetical protein
MISGVVLVLQSNVHLLKVEPCFPHPCNGIQDAEITDVKEEGDPEPITFPVMKSDDEVSCVCTCQVYFTNVENCLLPVHMKQFHSGEQILEGPFHNAECCISWNIASRVHSVLS